MGLAYLNAALKKTQCEVKIFCPSSNGSPDKLFDEKVRRFDPDIVGISIKSATLINAKKIISSLREMLPVKTTFLAGGPHISLLKENIESIKGVDLLIAGDAEISFPEIVDAIDSLKSSNNKVFMSKEISDLDRLEFPEFDGFMPEVTKRLETAYGLLTSRGCPYQCTYCTVGSISGKKWRYRSPENVIAELIRARKLYNTKEFYILDDNFTLNLERAKKICELLIQSGLDMKWGCPNGIRADRLDRELAILMKKSGCWHVSLGIESADEEVFAGINKGETLHDVSKAIALLKEQDMNVKGFFIIGLPNDTYERTLKALPFIKRTGLDEAFFNLFVPYPFSKAEEWVKMHGIKLLDFHKGRHQLNSPQPVFETSDFTAAERIKAYELLHTRVNKLYPFLISPSDGKIQRIFKTLQLLSKYNRKNLPKYIVTELYNTRYLVARVFSKIAHLMNDWICFIMINTFLLKKVFIKFLNPIVGGYERKSSLELRQKHTSSQVSLNNRQLKILLINGTWDCAGVSINLCKAINKYTRHQARHIVGVETYLGYDTDITMNQYNPMRVYSLLKVIEDADIFHFNHTDHTVQYKGINWSRFTSRKKRIYHSHSGWEEGKDYHEEFLKGKLFNKYDNYDSVIECAPCNTFVFNNSVWLPNLLPVYDESYLPLPNKDYKGRLIIGQSPSVKRIKSTNILNKVVYGLQQSGYDIELDVIEKTRHRECLARKKYHHIEFDNMHQGHLGMAGFEAASMGIVTMGWMKPSVQEAYTKLGEGNDLPFINVGSEEELRDELIHLIEDRELLLERSQYTRLWMERYYTEKRLLALYVNLYEGLLE